jgi:hypothetical protein
VSFCAKQLFTHFSFRTRRHEDEDEDAPQQRQVQILQQQLSPHELAYQESLIQEREQEIREIENGIHELSEIFRDLGTLVHQQGGMLGASGFHSILVLFSSTMAR